MTISDNSHSLKPLIINLPLDKDEYFPILDKQKAVTMQSGLVTLKSGDDVGSHNTENYEEFIIILEGSGEIETEGTGRRKIGRRGGRAGRCCKFRKPC